MSDNNKRSVYNRETQLKYNQSRLQMSFRFSKEDKPIEDVVKKYMNDYNLSSGGLARIAVIEKMRREGYLN